MFFFKHAEDEVFKYHLDVLYEWLTDFIVQI